MKTRGQSRVLRGNQVNTRSRSSAFVEKQVGTSNKLADCVKASGTKGAKTRKRKLYSLDPGVFDVDQNNDNVEVVQIKLDETGEAKWDSCEKQISVQCSDNKSLENKPVLVSADKVISPRKKKANVTIDKQKDEAVDVPENQTINLQETRPAEIYLMYDMEEELNALEESNVVQSDKKVKNDGELETEEVSPVSKRARKRSESKSSPVNKKTRKRSKSGSTENTDQIEKNIKSENASEISEAVENLQDRTPTKTKIRKSLFQHSNKQATKDSPKLDLEKKSNQNDESMDFFQSLELEKKYYPPKWCDEEDDFCKDELDDEINDINTAINSPEVPKSSKKRQSARKSSEISEREMRTSAENEETENDDKSSPNYNKSVKKKKKRKHSKDLTEISTHDIENSLENEQNRDITKEEENSTIISPKVKKKKKHSKDLTEMSAHDIENSLENEQNRDITKEEENSTIISPKVKKKKKHSKDLIEMSAHDIENSLENEENRDTTKEEENSTIISPKVKKKKKHSKDLTEILDHDIENSLENEQGRDMTKEENSTSTSPKAVKKKKHSKELVKISERDMKTSLESKENIEGEENDENSPISLQDSPETVKKSKKKHAKDLTEFNMESELGFEHNINENDVTSVNIPEDSSEIIKKKKKKKHSKDLDLTEILERNVEVGAGNNEKVKKKKKRHSRNLNESSEHDAGSSSARKENEKGSEEAKENVVSIPDIRENNTEDDFCVNDNFQKKVKRKKKKDRKEVDQNLYKEIGSGNDQDINSERSPEKKTKKRDKGGSGETPVLTLNTISTEKKRRKLKNSKEASGDDKEKSGKYLESNDIYKEPPVVKGNPDITDNEGSVSKSETTLKEKNDALSHSVVNDNADKNDVQRILNDMKQMLFDSYQDKPDKKLKKVKKKNKPSKNLSYTLNKTKPKQQSKSKTKKHSSDKISQILSSTESKDHKKDTTNNANEVVAESLQENEEKLCHSKNVEGKKRTKEKVKASYEKNNSIAGKDGKDTTLRNDIGHERTKKTAWTSSSSESESEEDKTGSKPQALGQVKVASGTVSQFGDNEAKKVTIQTLPQSKKNKLSLRNLVRQKNTVKKTNEVVNDSLQENEEKLCHSKNIEGKKKAKEKVKASHDKNKTKSVARNDGNNPVSTKNYRELITDSDCENIRQVLYKIGTKFGKRLDTDKQEIMLQNIFHMVESEQIQENVKANKKQGNKRKNEISLIEGTSGRKRTKTSTQEETIGNCNALSLGLNSLAEPKADLGGKNKGKKKKKKAGIDNTEAEMRETEINTRSGIGTLPGSAGQKIEEFAERNQFHKKDLLKETVTSEVDTSDSEETSQLNTKSVKFSSIDAAKAWLSSSSEHNDKSKAPLKSQGSIVARKPSQNVKSVGGKSSKNKLKKSVDQSQEKTTLSRDVVQKTTKQPAWASSSSEESDEEKIPSKSPVPKLISVAGSSRNSAIQKQSRITEQAPAKSKTAEGNKNKLAGHVVQTTKKNTILLHDVEQKTRDKDEDTVSNSEDSEEKTFQKCQVLGQTRFSSGGKNVIKKITNPSLPGSKKDKPLGVRKGQKETTMRTPSTSSSSEESNSAQNRSTSIQRKSGAQDNRSKLTKQSGQRASEKVTTLRNDIGHEGTKKTAWTSSSSESESEDKTGSKSQALGQVKVASGAVSQFGDSAAKKVTIQTLPQGKKNKLSLRNLVGPKNTVKKTAWRSSSSENSDEETLPSKFQLPGKLNVGSCPSFVRNQSSSTKSKDLGTNDKSGKLIMHVGHTTPPKKKVETSSSSEESDEEKASPKSQNYGQPKIGLGHNVTDKVSNQRVEDRIKLDKPNSKNKKQKTNKNLPHKPVLSKKLFEHKGKSISKGNSTILRDVEGEKAINKRARTSSSSEESDDETAPPKPQESEMNVAGNTKSSIVRKNSKKIAKSVKCVQNNKYKLMEDEVNNVSTSKKKKKKKHKTSNDKLKTKDKSGKVKTGDKTKKKEKQRLNVEQLQLQLIVKAMKESSKRNRVTNSEDAE